MSVRRQHVLPRGLYRFVAAMACSVGLGFGSCMPDPLEVSGIPAVKPEIVVSSQILSDTLVVVALTKTIGALDASEDSDPYKLIDEIAVTDATVSITTKGKSYILPHLQDGAYQGHHIPMQPGDTCALNVTSPSLGLVSASTIVQQAVMFDTVTAGIYPYGDLKFAQVSYRLTDPAAQNYYMINVQAAKREVRIRNVMNPDAYIKLVEDNSFNGTSFSEVFISAPYKFESGDSIAVSLVNVTKDYYDFLKLRAVNRLGLVEYLSEPITYPTNVKGGRGYFNLHIPDVRVLVLE
ncbi:MAG TPA: DUF4249 domain-containing protein [Chryseosolibacter sp.]|nr:DUF4249 domain-containing protein [Chryseosolibacter sp.]